MATLYDDLADFSRVTGELITLLATEPGDERHRKIYNAIDRSMLNKIHDQFAAAIDDE